MTALRAVDNPGDKPVQRRRSRTTQKATAKATIQNSAKTGDRRRLLVTLRNHIAAQLDEGVPPRDLSSLTTKLLAISAEIAEIDAAAGEGDDVADAAATPDEVWDPATS